MAKKDVEKILIRIIRASVEDILREQNIPFESVSVDKNRLGYSFSFGLDTEVEMSGAINAKLKQSVSSAQLRQLQVAMVKEWEALISGINELGTSMDVEKKDCSVNQSGGNNILITFDMSAD